VISCCLAPGENHEVPVCLEPGDDLHYPLEVVDWCFSRDRSSVTIRALTCPSNQENNTLGGNSSTAHDDNGSGCFEMQSTPDGKIDVMVAYNPLSSSRPHGYQRRTGAQIDLRAGILTRSEAPTVGRGLIATHGVFMLVGWVVLAPLGVYVVRYMKTRMWRLVAHVSIMVSSKGLGLAAVSLKLSPFSIE